MIAGYKPVRYCEVGSGNFTKFARRAVRDFDLGTEIISLDPFPRTDINMLCDRIIRQPLEDLDAAVFDELEAEDIHFLDKFHRVFQNSNVTVFFLELLPHPKAGTIVQIHDILLPFNYPASWISRRYA